MLRRFIVVSEKKSSLFPTPFFNDYVPSKEVLTEHYGKFYGDSLTAFHNAMAVVKQDKKTSETDSNFSECS